jgi:hypothetical protein
MAGLTLLGQKMSGDDLFLSSDGEVPTKSQEIIKIIIRSNDLRLQRV